MGYLVAVIGAGCLVNLALMLAAIRQVRRQGEQLAAQPLNRMPPARLPAGAKAPEFTATTMTGQTRSLADLTGERSLVAFFSPRCGPCRTQLPEFVEYAKKMPSGADKVLAVVDGAEDEAREFASDLQGVASVVVEPTRGPMSTTFSVSGFPTFYVLDEAGTIEVSGAAVFQLTAQLV